MPLPDLPDILEARDPSVDPTGILEDQTNFNWSLDLAASSPSVAGNATVQIDNVNTTHSNGSVQISMANVGSNVVLTVTDDPAPTLLPAAQPFGKLFMIVSLAPSVFLPGGTVVQCECEDSNNNTVESEELSLDGASLDEFVDYPFKVFTENSGNSQAFNPDLISKYKVKLKNSGAMNNWEANIDYIIKGSSVGILSDQKIFNIVDGIKNKRAGNIFPNWKNNKILGKMPDPPDLGNLPNGDSRPVPALTGVSAPGGKKNSAVKRGQYDTKLNLTLSNSFISTQLNKGCKICYTATVRGDIKVNNEKLVNPGINIFIGNSSAGSRALSSTLFKASDQICDPITTNISKTIRYEIDGAKLPFKDKLPSGSTITVRLDFKVFVRMICPGISFELYTIEWSEISNFIVNVAGGSNGKEKFTATQTGSTRVLYPNFQPVPDGKEAPKTTAASSPTSSDSDLEDARRNSGNDIKNGVEIQEEPKSSGNSRGGGSTKERKDKDKDGRKGRRDNESSGGKKDVTRDNAGRSIEQDFSDKGRSIGGGSRTPPDDPKSDKTFFLVDTSSSTKGMELVWIKNAVNSDVENLLKCPQTFNVFQYTGGKKSQAFSSPQTPTERIVNAVKNYVNAFTSKGGTDPKQIITTAIAAGAKKIYLYTDDSGVAKAKPKLEAIFIRVSHNGKKGKPATKVVVLGGSNVFIKVRLSSGTTDSECEKKIKQHNAYWFEYRELRKEGKSNSQAHLGATKKVFPGAAGN